MNQKDSSDSIIPGLTRNPVVHYWIPAPQGCFLWGAFAGMTWLSIVFNMTIY